jgi:aminoglycoside phosphotransferase (APT) family kinase protein
VIEPEILRAIPGCENGQPPLSVAPLVGGRGCNEILRVDTNAGRFVLRRRLDPVLRPGSDSRRERLCQQQAAGARLAPAIVAAAEDANWLVMEFVEGPVWRQHDLLAPQGVRRLGQQLAALHACALPGGLAAVDPAAIARAQLQEIGQHAPARLADARLPAQRVADIMAARPDIAAGRAIVHGDLQASNLVGDRPVLVDWEYAQIADPTYDIACLLVYYPQLEPQLETLLGAAQLGRAGDRELLALQRELFDCLNRLWILANDSAAG